MEYCTKCGHELGIGRYCTNCGHPIGTPVPAAAAEPTPDAAHDPAWRTDTAERLDVPVTPPAARFPLFADEADDAAYDGPTTGAATATGGPSRPWGIYAAIAVAAVLVVVLGVAVLVHGHDDAQTPAAHETSASSSTEPTDESSGDPSDQTAGQPKELAKGATVDVPATSRPSRDVEGNPVDFAGKNMVDGDTTTTWRMPGSGAGSEITFTLPRESRLRTVGLINGYAKRELGRDWYRGNRRVLRVEWVFDDGTTVEQDLKRTRDMQTIDVDATTTTVTLRLVDVSRPGNGPARRDFTAISEVSLVGG